MPVSLERLIAEVEPNVITEKLTRDCVQVRMRELMQQGLHGAMGNTFGRVRVVHADIGRRSR